MGDAVLNCATRVVAAGVVCVALVSCGGGDNPQHTTPRAHADAAEARARGLIQLTGCSSNAQCGYVTFLTPFYSCSQGEHAPYLVVARNAKLVSANAEEQRFWAAEARKLEPTPNFGCATYVEPPPIPICQQSQCSLKSGFEVFEVTSP
jgi:hypothetical protein